MKRFFCLLLSLLMLPPLCATAFAYDGTLSPDATVSNNESIAFLDTHYIGKDKLLSIDKDGSNPKYIYQLTDTICAEIVITETPNGQLLTVKEGALVNTLEITTDGRYILNGNTVTFSGSETVSELNTPTIMPRYAVDSFYTDICPYGSASDYTTHLRNKSVACISFGTAFANVTLTVFTAIIGKYVSPILGFSTGVVGSILASFQEYDPHSTCASYEEEQLVHRTKGSFVTIEKSVIKYDMLLYSQEYFNGNEVSKIAYKVTLWENGEG